MWHRIRTALLSPQAVVVLALLLLVTDALLSIFSPASAATHEDRPRVSERRPSPLTARIIAP
jgi:hypothetical protein